LLVTGGAGFVGSHLIRALLQREPTAQIVSLDNYFTGLKENHLDDPRVTYLTGDVVDVKAIWSSERLPAPAVVYHMGEYSRIVPSLEEFDRTWESNTRGTKEVLTFTAAHGAKLVYAGSSSKFGNDGQDENLNPYAWTKAKNVELIKNYADWFGLGYVITYFYNVYGPGHIRTGKYATVIGLFEDQFDRGVPLTVVEPGTQTRDFTYIDDIVTGILAAADRGSGDGYLLGTGREWPIIEVARMFGTEIRMVPPLPGERVRGQADTTKARSLGWEPKTSLEDYIRDYVSKRH
jgi:UDP-glucose 4-epimerase